MMSQKAVYFVCVNFNNSSYTKEFLESVSLQQYDEGVVARPTTVVVDNASNQIDQEAVESLCRSFENAKLVRSLVNLGYFGGLNLGLSFLDLKPGDLVVIGNNDLTFAPNFLATLANQRYANDVLVVAPNVITADGYHQNPHCRTRVSLIRKLFYDLYFTNYWIGRLLILAAVALKRLTGRRQNPHSQYSQYIHMGIGACYVLLPAFFDHFSKLDDSVFLYGEEALLAGQVMSAPGRTYYDAELIVIHAERAALSKVPSRLIYQFGKESYPKYKNFL
jgi:GT2 family glycosyltransferase